MAQKIAEIIWRHNPAAGILEATFEIYMLTVLYKDSKCHLPGLKPATKLIDDPVENAIGQLALSRNIVLTAMLQESSSECNKHD